MTIVLADHSDLVRDRLRDLLSEFPSAHVVGEATNTQETIALVRQFQPDLLFLKFPLPGSSGLETLQTLKISSSPPLIILLTDNSSPEYQTSCRSAGADHVFDEGIEIAKITTLLRHLIR